MPAADDAAEALGPADDETGLDADDRADGVFADDDVPASGEPADGEAAVLVDPPADAETAPGAVAPDVVEWLSQALSAANATKDAPTTAARDGPARRTFTELGREVRVKIMVCSVLNERGARVAALLSDVLRALAVPRET